MLTREILEDFRYIVLFGATEDVAREMLEESENDAILLGWEITGMDDKSVVLKYPSGRFMPNRWKIRIAYPGVKMCSLQFNGSRPDFCLYRGKPKVRNQEEMTRVYDWINKVFLPAFRNVKYPHMMFHPA